MWFYKEGNNCLYIQSTQFYNEILRGHEIFSL
jgi:hypothetical protein